MLEECLAHGQPSGTLSSVGGRLSSHTNSGGWRCGLEHQASPRDSKLEQGWAGDLTFTCWADRKQAGRQKVLVALGVEAVHETP